MPYSFWSYVGFPNINDRLLLLQNQVMELKKNQQALEKLHVDLLKLKNYLDPGVVRRLFVGMTELINSFLEIIPYLGGAISAYLIAILTGQQRAAIELGLAGMGGFNLSKKIVNFIRYITTLTPDAMTQQKEALLPMITVVTDALVVFIKTNKNLIVSHEKKIAQLENEINPPQLGNGCSIQ